MKATAEHYSALKQTVVMTSHKQVPIKTHDFKTWISDILDKMPEWAIHHFGAKQIRRLTFPSNIKFID